MLSVALALLVAAAAFAGGFAFFGVGSAIFLGLLAALPTFVLLVRRVRKRAEAGGREIEAHIKAQRFERAIERLESLRPLGRWQPMLASSIDEQIGILRYAALRDFEGARPYLERARSKSAQGWAMLGASLFKKGRHEEMEQVFERAVRRRKKEGLLWAAYAWCAWKRGDNDKALRVLARGRERLPKDERLQRVQLALQNEKRMKMKPFGPDWFALHLEPMPAAAAGGGVSPTHPALRGMRGVRMRTRGA